VVAAATVPPILEPQVDPEPVAAGR
jgi:hypothetical protein